MNFMVPPKGKNMERGQKKDVLGGFSLWVVFCSG